MWTDWRRGDRNQPTWCACASTRCCPTESCSTSILYDPPPAADAAVFAGTEFCQSYTSAASKHFILASNGIICPCIVRPNLGIMDITDPNFLILSDGFQHVLFLCVWFFSCLCLFLKVYKYYRELCRMHHLQNLYRYSCALGLTLKFVGHTYLWHVFIHGNSHKIQTEMCIFSKTFNQNEEFVCHKIWQSHKFGCKYFWYEEYLTLSDQDGSLNFIAWFV